MYFQHFVFVTTLLGWGAVNASFPLGCDEDGIDRLVKRFLEHWHTLGMTIAIIDGENTWAKASHFHAFIVEYFVSRKKKAELFCVFTPRIKQAYLLF